MPARAAVYDLGSSSFHLLVCDATERGSLVPVLRRRAWLHLGAAIGAGGAIPGDRAMAAVRAARRLRHSLEETDPDVVVAYATAALRDATNGGEVVGRLERVLGRPVQVLDGPTEATLCFLGQRAGVWSDGGPGLGIDLGGGSLEIAFGTEERLDLATSVPIGAARLRSELGPAEVVTPDDHEMIRCRTTVALDAVRATLAARPGSATRAVLSGGTARALARIAVGHARRTAEPGTIAVNQVELPAHQVAQLAADLGSRDIRSRLTVQGMNPKRVATLPVGAAILAVTADVLDIGHFVVSEWGLREGALLTALEPG